MDLSNYAVYIVQLFNLSSRIKIRYLIVFNLIRIIVGAFLSRICAKGFSGGIVLREMKRNDKIIDQIPKGFFRKYAAKIYKNTILCMIINYGIFLLETIFLHYYKAFQIGSVLYIILIMCAAIVYPICGKNSCILRMYIDEEGFRNYLKDKNKEIDDKRTTVR